TAFASESFREAWARVERQWKQIHRWLFDTDCPLWFSDLVRSEGNLPWLILLIQSRLFLPASWTFPLWHTDFGVALTSRMAELFPSFATEQRRARLWHLVLDFLLTNRLAINRFLEGTGTAARLEP